MMNKKEIETRIAEIQQELDTLNKQLNEPKKTTGWEKPNGGHVYWYIGHRGEARESIWYNDSIDHERYAHGNCFASKELAENIARYQSLDLRIRRRIAEICEPVNWIGNAALKHGVYYNYTDLRVDWYMSSWRRYCPWHCDTEEHAKQIIEEFKDELTWYFTEFKDRMDG